MTDPTQAAREAAERIVNAPCFDNARRNYELAMGIELELLTFHKAGRQAALKDCRAELAKWPTYGDYCDALDRMIASPAPKEEPHGC